MDYGMPPTEWGAMVDYDTWTDRAYVKERAAVHYNGPAVSAAVLRGDEEAEKQFLRAVERYHKVTRGWRGIAYAWAIGNSGIIYRLRGWNRYGAHRGDYDGDGTLANDEIIPIFFMVGADQHPTTQAKAAFEWLINKLNDDNRSDGFLEVIGHRDVDPRYSTTCPGEPIMGWLATREDNPMANVTVEELQEVLNDAGQTDYEGKRLVVDGVYGRRTKSAWVKGLTGSGPIGDHSHDVPAHTHSYAAPDHKHGGVYANAVHSHEPAAHSHTAKVTEETTVELT